MGELTQDTASAPAPYRWWVLANVVWINVLVTGVSWVDGELWHGTEPVDERCDVLRIDPDDGKVMDSIRLPEGDYCSGVEADNSGRMWCGGKRNVRAIRRPD